MQKAYLGKERERNRDFDQAFHIPFSIYSADSVNLTPTVNALRTDETHMLVRNRGWNQIREKSRGEIQTHHFMLLR